MSIAVHERLSVVEGDITKLAVDAIINAANTTLLGGGGVDGAIHRAAGPELRAECAKLGGCATGDAKLTKGHRLPARFVIHTVGPVWSGGQRNEDTLLASCYRRSLEIARDEMLLRIAFPAISTGAYGFPQERAARIAVETVAKFLLSAPSPKAVIFCCFGAESVALHRRTVDLHRGASDQS